jgi:TRAP transporter 4TM/12TM fusion protein
LSLFTLYSAAFIRVEAQIYRAIFLAFILPLVFIWYPASPKQKGSARVPWYDWGLVIISVLPYLWIMYSHKRILFRLPYVDPMLKLDFVFGALALVLVFEATRRVLGWVLVVLAAVFLLYAYYGPYFPGLFSHRGFSIPNMVDSLYLGMDGLFNFLTGIIATFVIMFIIFAAFLERTGIGQFYMDLCLGLAGRSAGGPAKVAVLSSAMMGTISGSTVANVVTTGTLTIPLMKSTGYEPHEAAGIESAASLGGAIMPPVMGAGALIMAEMTGIPYGRIILMAIIPAVLYFSTVLAFVHFKALKKGLKGLPPERIPRLVDVVKVRGHLMVPVVGLIYYLLRGYTPFYAGFVAVVLAVAISMVRKETRLNLGKIVDALAAAGKNTIAVGAISACAAVIVGIIIMSGLVTKFASIIVELSGGVMFFAILLTALTSYVLGMALPVSTCYVLQSIIAVPALMRLGASLIGAHMLVFWYSQDATITPPVCMTAFTAAAVAGAEPMRSGWEALKVAKGLYFIPLLFIYSSLLGGPPLMVLRLACTALVALVAVAGAFEGYVVMPTRWYERLLLVIAAIPLFHPADWTDVLGVLGMAAVIGGQLLRKKRLLTVTSA